MPEALPELNAGLVKRLAEAADSFRDGKYYYFICKLAYPFDLKYTSGHPDEPSANAEGESLLAANGTEYRKFGPFKTPTDNELPIDYDSIQLRFMNNNGDELHSETLAKGTDAIVLSLSAYDKFFHPYYIRLYGDLVAAEFRSEAKKALTSDARKPPPTHNGGTLFKVGDFER